MFKKIEIWILYLFILLSLPFAGMFGFLVRQELAGKYTFGKFEALAGDGALLTKIDVGNDSDGNNGNGVDHLWSSDGIATAQDIPYLFLVELCHQAEVLLPYL